MPTPRRLGRLALLATFALVAGLLLAAPATATFPGPNGRIAFADFGTGQLYSTNPDGTGLRQLTHVPEGSVAAQPDWSPDSRQITFWSDLGGEPRLYVMDRDGSHQRLVFADQPGYGNVSPGYTPDGRRLVFQRCAPEPIDVCAIYSVGVDGRNLRALTRFKTGLESANDFWPTVAPDGRIAFGRFGAGGITSQVYVMAADGSGARPITPPALTAIPGEWTPDSRHLNVQSNGFRLNASIYRVRADGTGLRRLTRPSFPNGDIQPNSSPNGDRIAFASDRRYPDVCCNDLYVMRSDGSGLHRVPTGDLAGVVDPDWGSAPRDDGTGAAAMATSSSALAGAGSAASVARLCASRPEPRPPGRCGTRAASNRLGDP